MRSEKLRADARRTKFIKESGPYWLVSLSNGEIMIRPEWSQFPEWNEEEGGGPGVFSRIRLADEIQDFLNVGTKPPDNRATLAARAVAAKKQRENEDVDKWARDLAEDVSDATD